MSGKKKEFNYKNYKQFFENLYPQLCVFGYKYLNDLDTSKDFVQEVFIKVWEDNIAFKSENHAIVFFYLAVKNKCINYLKSKHYKVTERYELTNLEAFETEDSYMPEAVVIETTAVIDKAISKLPEKAAQVIRLSIEDYTNNEIADELSISINTVKDHKKVAYRKLRDFLGFLNMS
ncbi:MAG: sigma-70 family RNA polymerase sigma factor [Algibacter sp.]